MTEPQGEIHRGEILLKDFMKPMDITARQLAADTDVPPSRISDVVNGKAALSPTQPCAWVCWVMLKACSRSIICLRSTNPLW